MCEISMFLGKENETTILNLTQESFEISSKLTELLLLFKDGGCGGGPDGL
jgi:hypothetical protein